MPEQSPNPNEKDFGKLTGEKYSPLPKMLLAGFVLIIALILAALIFCVVSIGYMQWYTASGSLRCFTYEAAKDSGMSRSAPIGNLIGGILIAACSLYYLWTGKGEVGIRGTEFKMESKTLVRIMSAVSLFLGILIAAKGYIEIFP